MKVTEKWNSIQALRGMAVVGVLAYHSQLIERKYSQGDTILPELIQLGQTGVDLFFVISGFIMVAVTRGRFGRKGEVARFLWNRVTRIYPTYWFYMLLTLAIFIIKPMWVNATQGHDAALISSFLLLPSQKLPLLMVAWSLIHEVWFYLVFAILIRAGESNLPRWLLCWAAVVTTSNLFMRVDELSPHLHIALHPYSIEFIIGALASIITHKKSSGILSPRQAGLVIAAILLVGIPLVVEFDVFKNADLYRASILGPMYGGLILSITALEKWNGRIIPKSMVWIGDMSYTIYLSHVLVLSALGRVW